MIEVEVSLEDITDQDLLDEGERRGILPEEKSIDDFSDEEIRAAYEHAFGENGALSIQQVCDELYRSRTEAPQIVKDYIYQETGRTLP